ncbi:MAG: type II toxin-antitoxin system HicA family toxin [Candidatus Obscuribacterales bacterium]|nr:type II toxin-antitoxin system HicA family toxin [Candidatus Obscuribacterales bacterium]
MSESRFDDVEFSYTDGWYVAIALRPYIASQGNTAEEAGSNLLEALALHDDYPTSTRPIDRMSRADEAVFTKLTFRQIRFKLENAGFTEVRQLGNHAKFVRREDSQISTAVMPHYIEIASSVLASIVRQSGLDPVYFWECL